MKPEIPLVTFYTRKGCHLCDVAREEIEKLRPTSDFRMEIVDIDQDPELQAKFTAEVPVVFINGKKAFKYRIDPGKFLRRLKQ